MEIDPSPQDKAKELIHKYFFQLTKGCGRSNCTNEFCASNQKIVKKDPQSAAVESLRLAKIGSQNLHENDVKKIESLNIETVNRELSTCASNSDYTPLVRKFGVIFAHPDHLNNMFLKSEIPKDDFQFGLNIEDLRKFYQTIRNLPVNNVMNSMMNALERIMPTLKLSAPSITNPELLRQFIIILENPMIADPENHKSVLGPLNMAINLLPKESQNLLKEYFSHYNLTEFKHFLGIFQQAITVKTLLKPNNAVLNDDEHIIAAVKVIHLLYDVNQKMKFLDYSEFYNELVIEKMDLREDFTNWRNKTGFSFCDHPFILDASVKSKVLHIESLVQQRQEREEAFRQLFMGTVNSPALVLKIRRERLIEDSLSEISRHPGEDLKKELRVHFVGEEAIDEGGVQKEWFALIVREIFDVKYGMFIHNEETRTYWFNSLSTDFLEFQLIGTLLGLALYNQVILDIHFPSYIYRKLYNQKATLLDLKETHPALASGFEKLLVFEGDVEETYGTNFQIQYEYFGEARSHDLVPDGAKVTLTKENRQQYVDLYVQYLLEESTKKQFDSFQKGFFTVCNSRGFYLFQSKELELVICGSQTLDFEALEKNTKYDNGFTKDHPTIKMFWEGVHSLSLEQKKRLLFFTTGSDRSPIGGLGNLQFIITRHGTDNERLPSAHTCFNILLLPEYNDETKLKDRLLSAIENAEGFGMK